jgi:uncharacterized protein
VLVDAPPVVVIRTIFRGQVWTAVPNYLIEDSPERVVTAQVPGGRCRFWAPTDKYDDPVARVRVVPTLASGRWTTVETTWHTNRILWVWARAASYMIGHLWEDATGQFRGWYLNLQTPLRRSSIGFDLWDQLLDVVVRPDRTWFWKDEDQFDDAIRLGVIGSEEAVAVRAQGERLIRRLDALLPTGWEGWRPMAGWPALELPADWERIEEDADDVR